jgi:prepilin-type N-terminal cleavage/methylation domain-containing protein
MTAAELKTRPGFSLMEIIIVVAVIGILAAVIAPNITRSMAESRIRAEARSLDSLLQKSRMMAAISQKPVRVVLNCVRLAVDGCVANLQTAVYDGITVVGWRDAPGYRRVGHRVVSVDKVGAPGTDGDVSFDDLYWAIFMPDSRVYSDPRPFNLLFHDRSQEGADQPGWRVSLSNESGRVSVQRQTGTP